MSEQDHIKGVPKDILDKAARPMWGGEATLEEVMRRIAPVVATAFDAVGLTPEGKPKESSEVVEFPLYKMLIDGKESWLPMDSAGVAYDSGWVPVSIGGLVLDKEGMPREISDEERTKIADIADDYSASK